MKWYRYHLSFLLFLRLPFILDRYNRAGVAFTGSLIYSCNPEKPFFNINGLINRNECMAAKSYNLNAAPDKEKYPYKFCLHYEKIALTSQHLFK
jgi:hypothetical protein